MNRILVQFWMLVAMLAAVSAGCGRGTRTAANDPFLDDPTRLAGAHSPSPGAPAEKPGHFPPAQAYSKPQVAASTPPDPPRQAITAASRDSSDPFLAMEKPASRPQPRTAGNPFGERAPPHEEVTAQKIAAGSNAAGRNSKARPKTLDQWENPFESNAHAVEKPAAEIQTAATERLEPGIQNPFEEETQAPTPRVNPVAHSKPAIARPQSKNNAAPFPDKEVADEFPFGVSEPKPRSTVLSKPIARTTQPESVEDESPFGMKEAARPAPTPKTRGLEAKESPFARGMRPAAPPIHRPKNGSQVQSPDDEEFEENPFASKPARPAAPAPRAAAALKELDDVPDEALPTGRIRLSDSSDEEAFEEPADTRRRPVKRYLPMPAPGESGWKKHTSAEESEMDSADEIPWN